jgi:putative phosphoesterase
MRVGVVADTHITAGGSRRLPVALLEGLSGVDLILHAGDIMVPEVLTTLGYIAPVEAVAGNNDPPELVAQLGRQKLLTLEGWRVGLIHGDGYKGTTLQRALAAFSDAHVVVFGHSHQPYREWHETRLLLNPGSPTDKRRQPRYSYAVLELQTGGVQATLHYF